MGIYNQILDNLRQIPSLANNYDQVLAPFKGSFEDDKKRFFGIPSEERLIYFRTHYPDCYLAITDKGIYTRDLGRFFGITLKVCSSHIPFQDISKVQYSESDDGYYFYGNSLETTFICRSDFFSKGIKLKYRFDFADILTKASNSINSYVEYAEQGISLMKDGEEHEAMAMFEEAIAMFDKALDNIPNGDVYSDDLGYILLRKSRCLMMLEKYQEARDVLIIAKDMCSKSCDDDLLSLICANLALVTTNKIQAHNYLCQAYTTAPDPESKKTLITLINDLHDSEDFSNMFTSDNNLPERKVIMVMSDDSIPIQSSSILCLERRVIKSLKLEFPIGHPVEGLLYLAPPSRNKYYIPAMEYEDAVFIDKVNEYCYLLQCLGAKEIKVYKIAGKSLEEMASSNVTGGIALGHKMVGLNGNFDCNSNNSMSYDNSYKFSRKMTFNPVGKPFVPKDLNWLSIEPRWSRLITNRMNGSLFQYTEEISTSDNNILSETDEFTINAEIKTLITKFKGQVYIKDNTLTKSKELTTWRIEVIF